MSELNKRFPTLDAGFNYACGLMRAGVTMQESRMYQDQLRPNKRNVMFRLLGIERRTGDFCHRLCPDGEWGIEIDTPGTSYVVAGILGERIAQTQYFRCSAWYSKYLPYAVAMMKAEWVFPYRGINHESINSYFASVLGFVDLGLGRCNSEKWNRIDPEDVDLYTEVYNHSMEVRSPSLPFDEAFQPACAYVAIKRPDLVAKHYEKDCWIWEHVCRVLESMGRERPKYSRVRKAA